MAGAKPLPMGGCSQIIYNRQHGHGCRIAPIRGCRSWGTAACAYSPCGLPFQPGLSQERFVASSTHALEIAAFPTVISGRQLCGINVGSLPYSFLTLLLTSAQAQRERPNGWDVVPDDGKLFMCTLFMPTTKRAGTNLLVQLMQGSVSTPVATDLYQSDAGEAIFSASVPVRDYHWSW